MLCEKVKCEAPPRRRQSVRCEDARTMDCSAPFAARLCLNPPSEHICPMCPSSAYVVLLAQYPARLVRSFVSPFTPPYVRCHVYRCRARLVSHGVICLFTAASRTLSLSLPISYTTLQPRQHLALPALLPVPIRDNCQSSQRRQRHRNTVN